MLWEHGRLHDSRIYLVMSLFDEWPLATTISAEQTPVRQAAHVRTMIEVARALVELHGLKIWHVDLNPMNILCRWQGGKPVIRIVDFELIFHDHTVELNDSGEGDSTILESLDDLSTEYLARRSAEPVQALRAILEINRAVGGGAELNEVLNRALEGLMAVFPAAERGFILIVGPEGRPRLRALRQQAAGAQLPVLSRTILVQVINEGRAILIKDTAADPRFQRSKSVVSSFRTAMCVPLSGHDGRPLGMIQLDRRSGQKGFKVGDLDLLAALSVPVGVAVENHQLLKERAS